MLRVEIGLVTMRTRELSIRILRGDGGALRRAIHAVGDRRATGYTRQDASTSLRPDDLCPRGFLAGVGSETIRGRHAVGVGPDRALTVVVAKRAGRHRRVVRTTVTRRRWGNGLRIALRIGGRRQ